MAGAVGEGYLGTVGRGTSQPCPSCGNVHWETTAVGSRGYAIVK